jgi:hypothetical protein
MGLWASSPSSAVLQRVTPSPWSSLDVQRPSADAEADRRVDGTNAALSATRRGQAPQPHRGAPQAQGLTVAHLAEGHWSAPSATSSSATTSRSAHHPHTSVPRRRCHASVRGRHRAATPCGQKRRPWANLRRVVCPRGRPQHYSRPHGLPRPGDGTSDEPHRPCRPARTFVSLTRRGAARSSPPRYATAVASWPQQNSVPSSHMRCRTQASLRASATFARLRPRRLATSRAQRLSAEKRTGRLNTALAAS